MARERAVYGDVECARVLQQAIARRGAPEALIAEVMEDRIRGHMVDLPVSDPKIQAAE